MKITLSASQIEFIERALDLDNHIIDYELHEKDFMEIYGYSKEVIKSAVNDLREKLK